MNERDCPTCDGDGIVNGAPCGDCNPDLWDDLHDDHCHCLACHESPSCDCCGDPLDTDHPELCSWCLDEGEDDDADGPPPRPVETVDTGGRL